MQNSRERRFAALYKELYPDIYKFFTARLSDTDFADDLSQEAFLILYNKWDSVNTDSSEDCKRYMYAVAKNILFAHLRKAPRELAYDDIGTGALEVLEDTEHTEDRMIEDIEAPYESFDESFAVAEAIKELKSEDVELYELLHIKKLSYPELSEYFGKSEAAVRMRVHRMRKKLFEISKKYIK